ncbi:hypothetical protein ACVIGB_000963 [Bradyrhizobium sp. USDA 4341]
MPYFTAAISSYIPMLVAILARPLKAAIATLLVAAIYAALFSLTRDQRAS